MSSSATASHEGVPLVSVLPFVALGLAPAQAGAAIALARPPAAAATCAQLVRDWLRGSELERAAAFKVGHGRRDFLAGRIAAKSALRALAPATSPLDWEIVRGEWHRPLVRGPVGQLHVTLAHAAGIGLAVAHHSGWACGIDFEPRTRNADEAIASQMSPGEISWAQAAPSPAAQSERWLILWTAREALGKALGCGLMQPERLAPTIDWAPAPHGWTAGFANDDSFSVRVGLTPAFVLAWVIPSALAAVGAHPTIIDWLHAKLP